MKDTRLLCLIKYFVIIQGERPVFDYSLLRFKLLNLAKTFCIYSTITVFKIYSFIHFTKCLTLHHDMWYIGIYLLCLFRFLCFRNVSDWNCMFWILRLHLSHKYHPFINIIDVPTVIACLLLHRRKTASRWSLFPPMYVCLLRTFYLVMKCPVSLFVFFTFLPHE